MDKLKLIELIGLKWKAVEENIKNKLLENANYMCADSDGNCIIDLNEWLSVDGKIIFENDEYILVPYDDALIYSPAYETLDFIERNKF